MTIQTPTHPDPFSPSRPPQVFEARISGVTIQAPQLDIRTVAAGGGSRFFFREGLFAVGPESVRHAALVSHFPCSTP